MLNYMEHIHRNMEKLSSLFTICTSQTFIIILTSYNILQIILLGDEIFILLIGDAQQAWKDYLIKIEISPEDALTYYYLLHLYEVGQFKRISEDISGYKKKYRLIKFSLMQSTLKELQFKNRKKYEPLIYFINAGYINNLKGDINIREIIQKTSQMI